MYFRNHSFRKMTAAIIAIFSMSLLGQYEMYSQDDTLNRPLVPGKYGTRFSDVQQYYRGIFGDGNPGKGKGWKQYKRAEYFLEQRLFPDGELQSAMDSYNSVMIFDAKNKLSRTQAKADWQPLGPTTMPSKKTGSPISGLGRMNCIEIESSNSNVLWAGASFGGVWKSTDGGSSWITFPFTEFISIGISDIKISRKNPNTVYAATGDGDGSGGFTQFDSYSIGIIKTTDGGTTWSMAGLQNSPVSKIVIYSLAVNPNDDNIVYAGTNKGMYMTTDGGDTWSTVYTAHTVRQIVMKPTDPNTIYCSMYPLNSSYPNSCVIGRFSADTKTMKIVKTTDTYVGRIVLSVADSKSNGIYAICTQYEEGGGQGFHSLLKSTDSGENWSKVNSRSGSSFNYLGSYVQYNVIGGQGVYDLGLAVSPQDFDMVYIAGVNIWKSTDGGMTFNPIAEWTGEVNGVPWVHADIHELQCNNAGHLYAATDGGINRTTNSGNSWSDLSNGLQVSAFYKLACSKTNDNIMLLGAQDNGTHRYKNGTWDNVYGGDGMMPLIDYIDPRYMYCSTYYGNFFRSTDGGNTFTQMLNPLAQFGVYGAWVTPIEIDPVNPSIIYVGLVDIVKSTNRGQNFTQVSNLSSSGTFRALKIAPSNTNYIYGVKASGSASVLMVSKNSGKTWSTLYSSPYFITDIEVDPENPIKVWITLSGYSSVNKVVELNGVTLTNITNNLPNVPVNTVVYQKNSPDRLYIGTDYGVYYSESPGRQWVKFNDNLPNVVVSDLVIQENIGYLRAATYGRGLWQTKIINCDLAAPTLLCNGSTGITSIDICEGDSVILSPSADYYLYIWSNQQTTKSIVVKDAGTYYLTITDDKGCFAISSAITVNVIPAKEIKITTAGNSFCEGDSLELNANFGFTSYTWSNGMTGKKIYVKEAGTYTVTGSYSDSCSTVSDPVTVTEKEAPAKPAITLSDNTLVSTEAVSYQWYMEGQIINGAILKTYKPATKGNYQVRITNSEGCSSMSDIYYYDGIIGVEDVPNGLKYISIKPNPTNGSFIFETSISETSPLEITITDIMGSVIHTYSTLATGYFSKSFDLSSNPSGIYFINVKAGGTTWRSKLIKVD